MFIKNVYDLIIQFYNVWGRKRILFKKKLFINNKDYNDSKEKIITITEKNDFILFYFIYQLKQKGKMELSKFLFLNIKFTSTKLSWEIDLKNKYFI